MIEVGNVVRGTVEKLVFGGKGLIRHQGWVIFVEDVAVDEDVEVRIIAKKKSYFEAKLLQVIQPSPLRISAPCPYFGTCGGCQLQHLQYEEQLRLKKEWLIDAFIRTAKIQIDFPITVTPAKKQWGYRKKIILHTDSSTCGFYARDNQTLLEIDRCLIFSSKEFKDLKSIQAKNICVMQDENGEHLYAIDKTTDHRLVCTVEGLTFFYSAEVFIQNESEQAVQIYLDVLRLIDNGPILDLYCGIGILSLLAAKRGFKVLGVELNPQAINYAKMSAAENEISSVEFLALPCEEIADLALHNYSTWIVNPPRIGLSTKVMQIISKEKPAELCYISCMPATLARDVKLLYELGYKIQAAGVYDMFAQTTHLETVVYLKHGSLEDN